MKERDLWKKKEPGARLSVKGQADEVASSMERASAEKGGGQLIKLEFHRTMRGGILITPTHFHRITLRFVTPLTRNQILSMMHRAFPNYEIIQERV